MSADNAGGVQPVRSSAYRGLKRQMGRFVTPERGRMCWFAKELELPPASFRANQPRSGDGVKRRA